MRNPFLLLILICIFPISVWSQTPCQRTYDILKARTTTTIEDISIGTILFLSDEYLMNLRTGKYSAEESGLRHFEYIRPGTRMELRDGLNELAAENEILGPDGNVYRTAVTQAGTHFFRTKKGFHGDYEPQWRDPYLIIPPGLVPVDVRYSDGIPMQVIELSSSFLRLRVEEEEWVFFTGYPEISDLFDSQDVRKKLAEKQRLANNLIGGEYLLEFNRQIQFTPSPRDRGAEPATPLRRIEVVITEAIAQTDRVLLGFGNPTTYMVLEENTDLDFLDLACVRESLLNEALADPEVYQQTNRQLSEVVLRNVPVEEWARDDQLVMALSKRFRLQRDDRNPFGWYEHVMMMKEGRGRETFLTARLRNDGTCYLQSQYASRRGLYHTRIEIETDRGTRVSERIPTMDDRSSRGKSGAWTVERILFTDPMDQELLRILMNDPDASILVRYIAGGSFFEEVTLEPEYREIIRDVYLMGELVRYRDQG